MLIGLSKFTWTENWWFMLPRDTESLIRYRKWENLHELAGSSLRWPWGFVCLHALKFTMRLLSHWWWHFPGRNAQRLVNEITSCWWWSSALELSTMCDAMDSTHQSVNPWFTGTSDSRVVWSAAAPVNNPIFAFPIEVGEQLTSWTLSKYFAAKDIESLTLIRFIGILLHVTDRHEGFSLQQASPLYGNSNRQALLHATKIIQINYVDSDRLGCAP